MNQVIEQAVLAAQASAAPLDAAAFVAYEADLLDERRFDEWSELYADDGIYWVPAKHGQQSPRDHVSLFYDDKTILTTRVKRLLHPMIHCQEPASHCVRVLSASVVTPGAAAGEVQVQSKFVMVEDRVGAPQRVFAGRYIHTLRATPAGLRIVLKRVNLTNCDHSFPMLTQPI